MIADVRKWTLLALPRRVRQVAERKTAAPPSEKEVRKSAFEIFERAASHTTDLMIRSLE